MAEHDDLEVLGTTRADSETGEQGDEAVENARHSWPASAAAVLVSAHDRIFGPHTFARQCVKLAHFALWPFGRQAVRSPNAATLGPVGNVLWFIPGALLALGYVNSGLLMMVTVIGIPVGVQSFKMARLALTPFGKEIKLL